MQKIFSDEMLQKSLIFKRLKYHTRNNSRDIDGTDASPKLQILIHSREIFTKILLQLTSFHIAYANIN